MCSPQGIIDNIIGKAMDAAFQGMKCAIHYKKNHKDLKDEMEKFEEYRKDIIERKVEEAQNRGEDILAVVLSWRREADKMTQDFDNFMQQCTREESMLCFACLCPNFIRRYRLSKQAQEKKDKVSKLKQEGDFDEIALPKPPPPELPFPCNYDYEIVDSRASVFKAVVNALKDSKVTMIGVHGTGGIGKTTLVKEVSKQLKEDRTFDEVVMAVVSKDAIVSKIQSQLVCSLNLDLINATTEKQISYKLWHRLNNGKKNLVILDDIWKEVNLKDIGIPITDGNKGCKVMITSRNKDCKVVITSEINKVVDRDFALPLLPELEAWALFKKVAGNSVDSPELRLVAEEVCKECEGLPVAINALGAALKDKKISAWKTALVKLKKSMINEIEEIGPVYNSLKLSYEQLKSSDAKKCFLLCCLFPENAEISIDDLTRLCTATSLLHQNPYALEEARDAVCTAVGTLKTRYLLLDDTVEDVVKMHDIIRDVGISIAKAYLVVHGVVPEWPKRREYKSYSAISIRSQSMGELPNELACPKLRILMLESNNRSLLKVPDGFFNGMKELEVIDFKEMCMPPLPSSLPKLENLRMLCLNKCKLSDIAVLKDLPCTLEMLSLQGSDIKVLPLEIRRLTRLRLLDLRDCVHLRVIPHGVISNLTFLEELYFSSAFNQWDRKKTSGNVSLDELSSLTRLTTLHVLIPKDMLFPKEFSLNFENLVRFKIFIVDSQFYGYGENSERFLKLEGIPLKDELNTLVEKADELHLSGVRGLVNVLHNRGGEGFLNLKYLKVKSCYDLVDPLLDKPEWSMQQSRSFNKLTTLIIRDCRLEYLFSLSIVRELFQLQQLHVSDCEILEEIVGFEGEEDEDELIYFSKLKHIKLSDLPNLTSFYPKLEKTETTVGNSSIHVQSLFNEKVAFPALERLEINLCSQITDVWDKKMLPANSFLQLRVMEVRRCNNLVNVFQSHMVSRLQNLQEVVIINCYYMEVIISKKGEEEGDERAEPNDNIVLPQLRKLELEGLLNLKSFCTTRSEEGLLFNHKVAFPALERLEINLCSQITDVWDKKMLPANSFFQLRDMEVRKCDNLVNVFQSNMVSRLQNLQEIVISCCSDMEVIISKEREEEGDEGAEPNDNIVLPQLRNLELKWLENLESFCTTRSELVGFLFNHKVEFPALETLKIDDCSQITDVWDKKMLPANSFFQLRHMTVCRCDNLVNVFQSNMVSQLQNLQEVFISNCPDMEVIISKKGEEEGDEEAKPNDNIVLPQLRNLYLGSLNNLKSFFTTRSEAGLLFNHEVEFPALKWLEIDRCSQIIDVWDKKMLPANSFFQLRHVIVRECDNLVNVFQSNMVSRLQNLQELFISRCPDMEMIISKKGEEEGGEGVEPNDNIVLSQLRNLELKGLENLKSFCAARSEEGLLFNHKVAFPKLTELRLDNHLKEIFREGIYAEEECIALGEEQNSEEEDSNDKWGHCAEDDERGMQRLLIYEYMPNKSVQDHLASRFQTPLPRITRLKIAQDASRGLVYLHEGMEFQVVETVGYAAPEYIQTGHLTAKSDVWSYGAFLYELVTGGHPMDRNRPKNEQKLLEWVLPHLSDMKKFELILDPRLNGTRSSLPKSLQP
ncbi:Disease resistance protein [Actinidia chinensis var. chinensis]|uniref:Disease resistance protein n=1 Tax=Actinidia chinensis var. chinensis TaxID=1590841 RepID=A0A2R6R5F5_ACTCC|nr:Disease resistance protein [Actinidia chinensis var. chinensis]